MNPKLIVIDGRTYKDVNEMPPEVRAKYEQAMSTFRDGNQNNLPDAFENMNVLADKNNNGIPDVLENMTPVSVMSGGMKFYVNGQEYNAIENLPPEARAKYEQAMSSMDKNQNGVPDFLEGMFKMPNQASNMQSAPQTMPSPPLVSQKPMPVSSPTITPDTSNGWMLALVGALLLGLCLLGAAGVWYFFLR